MYAKKRFTWKNVVSNQVAITKKYFYPRTLDDLVEIIQEAERSDLKVRAIGSSHSWSDVALTYDYMVNTHKLNSFRNLGLRVLQQSALKSNLVEVEAGITIDDFNKGLDKKKKAIINMGGVDHQTLGGAISTSTHGSGIKLPAMPGMVKSLVLVTGEGKILRIEPSSGITDRQEHEKNYHRIELIQDDTVFNSAVVGLGTMGIVYSYIVEVRDTYYIHESRKIYSWKQVKEWILDGNIHNNKDNGEELRAVFVRINPYKLDPHGDYSALLIEHKELPSHPKPKITTRPFLFKIAGRIKFIIEIATSALKRKPEKSPERIETSMKASVDEEYVNVAHKVLFLGQELMKEYGVDTEFAFPAEEPEKLVQVIEDLIHEAKLMKDIGLYQSSPLGMRWVKKSTQYMSPDYGKDVCYVDTPNHSQINGAYEISERYQEVFFKLGGKPHWGKLHNRFPSDHIEKLKESFPGLQEWKEVAMRFDPKGTFQNTFTDRLKLRVKNE